MGHLVCAQEAHGALGLDRVLLMPLAEPTHRVLEDDPGAEVRAQLCELAVQGDARLSVSRAEVRRGGPSYTADTLRMLLEGDMAGHEITLILGADQACRLGSWREPKAVLSLARVAVAARNGVARAEVLARVGALAGAERIEFFDMPRIDISSSMVRRRAASGRAIRYLLPDSVIARIEADGLYRAPVAAGGA
jgi:nicotinate-nucleotide adenylyltransferase